MVNKINIKQLTPDELYKRLSTDEIFRSKMIKYLENTVSTDDSSFGPIDESLMDSLEENKFRPIVSPNSITFEQQIGQDMYIACNTSIQLH